jgi:pyruvate dehydrogenase E2 component (dihydrolipoamide acetyltransferase)
MRRTIAARLSQSMFSAPHYYLTAAIGMDALLTARKELNEGRNRKLSLNAFLIKLTAEALKRHPRLNASWSGDSIRLFARADIGLAVALEDGLITPVVRDCSSKGIEAIDAELADLVERARAGKLKPEEYAGAGFTISNLGSYGIEEFTAVINPPGSAILAVGAVMREPIAGPGDVIAVQSRMRATLSCDHRVIDGAVGAAFLDALRGMIENPFRTLL